MSLSFIFLDLLGRERGLLGLGLCFSLGLRFGGLSRRCGLAGLIKSGIVVLRAAAYS